MSFGVQSVIKESTKKILDQKANNPKETYESILYRSIIDAYKWIEAVNRPPTYDELKSCIEEYITEVLKRKEMRIFPEDVKGCVINIDARWKNVDWKLTEKLIVSYETKINEE